MPSSGASSAHDGRTLDTGEFLHDGSVKKTSNAEQQEQILSLLPVIYPIGFTSLQVSGIHTQVAYLKHCQSHSSSSSIIVNLPRDAADNNNNMEEGEEDPNSKRLRLRQVVQVELRAVIRGKEVSHHLVEERYGGGRSSSSNGHVHGEVQHNTKKKKGKEETEAEMNYALGVVHLALPSPSDPTSWITEENPRHPASLSSHPRGGGGSSSLSMSTSSSSRFNPFVIPLQQQQKKVSSSPQEENEQEEGGEKKKKKLSHVDVSGGGEVMVGSMAPYQSANKILKENQDHSERKIGGDSISSVCPSSSMQPPSSSSSIFLPCPSLYPSSRFWVLSPSSSSSSLFVPRCLAASSSFMPLDLRVQYQYITLEARVRIIETREVFPHVGKLLWKRQREIEKEIQQEEKKEEDDEGKRNKKRVGAGLREKMDSPHHHEEVNSPDLSKKEGLPYRASAATGSFSSSHKAFSSPPSSSRTALGEHKQGRIPCCLQVLISVAGTITPLV